MQDYQAFLAGKRVIAPPVGFEPDLSAFPPAMFPFQRDIAAWACRRGTAAVFATTGMGKTIIQIVFADQVARRTGLPVLILAPLAVAQQTQREGERFGIPVTLCREQADARDGINVTNYERLHLFDVSAFIGIVLDESGILKNFSGKTKRALVKSFAATPYKLCCTATPAPNDVIELTNHSEFLGIMPHTDVLTTFFISKGQDEKDGRFRLKRHAHTAFYRWLASWSMSLTKPSDLGYDDAGYELPPLNIVNEVVASDWKPEAALFFTKLAGVQERAAARRATLGPRVQRAVEIVQREPDEQWLIWCGLNDEQDAIERALDTSGRRKIRSVYGSDDPDSKARALMEFSAGDARYLVTKSSIAGWGLNFQSCARMLFVGLGDSFEQYFQALRRCWRFGQTRPVDAYIVTSDIEGAVYDNVLRKEREHVAMMGELLAAVNEFERVELRGSDLAADYVAEQTMQLPAWLVTCAPESTETEVVYAAGD